MGQGPTVKGTWIEGDITTIARWLVANDGSLKYPHWKDVQDHLKATWEKTPHWGDKTKKLSDFFPVPGRNAINNIIQQPRLYNWGQPDTAWSLGIHTANGLSDDCVGACMEIFQWTLRQPYDIQFTVSQANWISKLRWVHEAGGSPIGQVLHPENMYFIACDYAAQEKYVEGAKDQRGFRTPTLDVSLMLSANERETAEKIGLTAEWDANDDMAILNAHFKEANPAMWEYIQKEDQARRGVIDIDGATIELGRLLDRFKDDPELEETERQRRRILKEQVEGMWSMASRIMGRSVRFNALPNNAARFEVSLSVLSDICDAAEHSELDSKGEWRFSWTPNIEQAIDEVEFATKE